VRIAIDDVGAGYAGLRHILELQPDALKLDIAFTRDRSRVSYGGLSDVNGLRQRRFRAKKLQPSKATLGHHVDHVAATTRD
jgi:hypothetical protein